MRRIAASLALLLLCSHAVGTAAFSIQSAARSRTGSIGSRAVYAYPSSARAAFASPLFSAASAPQQQSPSLFRRLLGKTVSASNRSSLLTKFRRSFALVFTVSLLWFGAAGFSSLPAHASSTAAATATAVSAPTERVVTSNQKSLDKLVGNYVKSHMFDDDRYDPVESIYREAHDDALTTEYPQALREVASGALGSSAATGGVRVNDKDNTAGASIAALLTQAIGALQKRGLSQQAAILVLASIFVVAGPSSFLFAGMIIGGISKRNMNKTMKQRYGDTYTVDATIKPEEDVEAPDDEDDDDEEDDDDDADDDEDDDE